MGASNSKLHKGQNISQPNLVRESENAVKAKAPSETPPQPPEDQLNHMFEQFLKELSLPPEKASNMKQWDAGKKWTILCQQKTKEQLEKMGGNDLNVQKKTPQQAAEWLKSVSQGGEGGGNVAKELQNIEVAMRTETLVWVKDFISADGTRFLVDLGNNLCCKLNINHEERESQHQIVRILKALMNNTLGLSKVMTLDDGMDVISLCLDCDNIKIKTLVLQILAAVCFVPPNGYNLVLKGIQHFTRVKKDSARFNSIIRDLAQDDLEYQIACMIFVNAVVTTPEDNTLRYTLREEFYYLNIDGYIERLKAVRDDALQTQLQYFEDEAKSDLESISQAHAANLIGLDYRDTEKIIRLLVSAYQDCYGGKLINLILSQFLLVPKEYHKKHSYMLFLYYIVKDLTLQNDQGQLDIATYSLKVEEIVAKVSDHLELEKNEKLEKQVRKQANAIEQLEESVKSRDDVLHKRDAEIEGLKEQLVAQENIIANQNESHAKEIEELKLTIENFNNTKESYAQEIENLKKQDNNNTKENYAKEVENLKATIQEQKAELVEERLKVKILEQKQLDKIKTEVGIQEVVRVRSEIEKLEDKVKSVQEEKDRRKTLHRDTSMSSIQSADQEPKKEQDGTVEPKKQQDAVQELKKQPDAVQEPKKNQEGSNLKNSVSMTLDSKPVPEANMTHASSQPALTSDAQKQKESAVNSSEPVLSTVSISTEKIDLNSCLIPQGKTIDKEILELYQQFVNEKLKQVALKLKKAAPPVPSKPEKRSNGELASSTAPPPPPPGMGAPPPPPPGMGGPPPPPPPGMGGPPPPPPPGMGGPPGPPPPPGMMSMNAAKTSSVPTKPKIVPKNKMRQLQWTKIPPQATSKTIWNAVSQKDEDTIRSLVDLNEFEALFSAEKPKPTAEETAAAGEKEKEKKSTDKQKQVITVLDSKRSYNMSIMLSRIKMNFTEVREALLTINEEKISEQMIKQFLNFIPTSEEADLLSEHDSATENLGKGEQFFIEMLKIPRYEERLKCILYKLKFNERYDDIYPSINCILSASGEIKNSKKLFTVLQVILALGNYMNGDSFRGGAFGFQVDTLSKLSDTRSPNGKMTFLSYVVSIVEKKFASSVNIQDDLSHVEAAMKISLPTLLQEVAELSKGMQSVRNELLQHSGKDKGDNFKSAMQTFVDVNEKKMARLEDLRAEMEVAFNETVLFYNEDPKTLSPEAFFGCFWNFVQQFDKTRKEMQKELEAIKKMEANAKNKRPSLKPTKTEGPEPAGAPQGDRRGVMDDLISSLRTGDAFKEKSKRRRNTVDKKDAPVALPSAPSLNAQDLLAKVQAQ